LRSEIRSRSNSAIAASVWKVGFPAGLVGVDTLVKHAQVHAALGQLSDQVDEVGDGAAEPL
jgi:hypothetical protein